AEDGIRDKLVTGVQTCALPISTKERFAPGQEIGVRIGKRALEHGLICRFDPHWLAFGPALVSTAEQIDEMVALLDRSMGEVLARSEEHTSELQSLAYLVCRLLL